MNHDPHDPPDDPPNRPDDGRGRWPDTDTTRDVGDGKKPVEAGSDHASSDESGYRRDDYWRKEQEELPADVESKPAHGHDFDPPEERASGDDAEAYRPDDGSDDDSARTDDERKSGPPPHGR